MLRAVDVRGGLGMWSIMNGYRETYKREGKEYWMDVPIVFLFLCFSLHRTQHTIIPIITRTVCLFFGGWIERDHQEYSFWKALNWTAWKHREWLPGFNSTLPVNTLLSRLQIELPGNTENDSLDLTQLCRKTPYFLVRKHRERLSGFYQSCL